MRINLVHILKKGAVKDLVQHLLSMYAQEFQTTHQAVFHHLKTGDAQVGEYFAAWLRSQGWQVIWYEMPKPDPTYLEDGEWMCLSFGLLFSDTCDKLISWRLSHT